MAEQPKAGAEGVLAVARFADGKVLHGTTNDFNPARPGFHILVREPGPAAVSKTVDVPLAKLKAVFFVRSHGGDPKRVAQYDFDSTKGQGRRVVVTFKDGESIAGYTV